METVIQILKFFPRYFARILEAWIAWIWFFALDAVGLIVDTFMPAFSPPRWLYWAIPCVGYVIANAKIFLDYQRKLDAYEYHAPEYDIQVTNVSTNICGQGCHVNIYCSISIKPTTPWTGYLVKVTVDRENIIQGLGDWEVHTVLYENCASISNWPLEIPDSILNLQVRIRSETSDQIVLADADKWRQVTIPAKLIIGYVTQPIGEVEKLKSFTVTANIEKDLLSVLEHQTRTA